MKEEIQITNVTNLGLIYIANQLHEIVANFSQLFFIHVFRYQNSLADALSKDALSLEENHFVLEEFFVDKLVSHIDGLLSKL
jgi:hypothetical protein